MNKRINGAFRSDKSLLNEDQFRGLKKCHEKFDCLVYEMLLIKELRPRLNTQGDSISAKLFVQLVAKFPFLFMTNCFSCIYRFFIEIGRASCRERV